MSPLLDPHTIPQEHLELRDLIRPDLGKYSAVAKLFCSDTAMAVTVDAVQILGGYGFSEQDAVDRMINDAENTQIYEGTDEIQRRVIARTLS